MNYLKIGEMAELNNISVQTLRYYDRIDILKPKYIDEENGYRYYTLSQSAELDIIIFLRRLDFTLDEIRSIVNNPNQDKQIQKSVENKMTILEQEKKAIEIKLNTIKNFKESFTYFLDNKHYCDVRIESFPKRFIRTFKTDKNIYEMSMNEYERNLRAFKAKLQQENEDYFFFNVGSIMRKENFIEGNFYSDEMFIFVNPKEHPRKHQIIQEDYYAVSFCHLFENELEALEVFQKHLIVNNFKIKGDYICEVIHELPYKKQGQRNMFIRLQVPIEKI